jgi:hypothetical protein
VIAECHHVIANQRHRLVFDFAFEKIEVGRTLKYVARIDHQRVWILLTHAFDQRRATRDSALAAIRLVGLVDGVDLRMRIVRVQDCDQRFAGRNFQQRLGQG